MSIHKDPRWLKALSLTERLKTSNMPTEVDLSDKLEKRVKRWREPTGLTDEQRFQKKLDLGGLNEKTFFALLDESDEALRARFEGEPEWLADLIGLIEGAHTHRFPTDCLDGESRKGFFALVQPLADHAWSCFLGNVRDILGESVSQAEIERLCGLFTPAFAMKTMRNLTRTLILELQVRGLQGDLPGETPEVRFKNFVKMLEDNQARLEIFCQYPLLGRQLLTVFDFWVTVNTEYIRRLHEDQVLIHQHFGEGYTLAQLCEIQPDKGDHHRKGRAVIIALFENGRRLVYKPRDMRTDRCFQDLLDWLNQTGFEPVFKTLVTLDRDGYGWMEYTAVAPCENRDQVKRYYLRQGANLALLHTLAGTDFHHENILACGEYPMLIDLETLFPRYEVDAQLVALATTGDFSPPRVVEPFHCGVVVPPNQNVRFD